MGDAARRASKQDPGLTDVVTDQQERALESYVAVDRDSASRLGISSRDVDDALYDAFGQRQVSTIYTSLNQYHVVMEVDPQYAKSPEALEDIYVPANGGATRARRPCRRATRRPAPR